MTNELIVASIGLASIGLAVFVLAAWLSDNY